MPPPQDRGKRLYPRSRVLGNFATRDVAHVTIVTVATPPGGKVSITASSFNSVSLGLPPVLCNIAARQQVQAPTRTRSMLSRGLLRGSIAIRRVWPPSDPVQPGAPGRNSAASPARHHVHTVDTDLPRPGADILSKPVDRPPRRHLQQVTTNTCLPSRA